MMIDNRQSSGMNGGLEVCYLVDESKRITCSSFNVFIPSLMANIPVGDGKPNEMINKANILNENSIVGGDSNDYSVNVCGSVLAKSIHPYRFKHEGWIPDYKVDNSTYTTMDIDSGKIEEIGASSIGGVTEKDGPGPHTHPLAAALKLMSSIFKKLTSTSIRSTKEVHNINTEVDYQELNRQFIKKGHKMYGHFVRGSEFEFVIVAIDNVIPYYDSDTVDGVNDKQPTINF